MSMNRPCYALSTLLTVLAGFSGLVAPATGKAPGHSGPSQPPSSVCWVADHDLPILPSSVVRHLDLACVAWDKPLIANFGVLADESPHEQALFATTVDALARVSGEDRPSTSDRPPSPTPNTERCHLQWGCEEYAAYDLESAVAVSEHLRATDAEVAKTAQMPPGDAENSAQLAGSLSWDEQYQFLFDDSNYQPVEPQAAASDVPPHPELTNQGPTGPGLVTDLVDGRDSEGAQVGDLSSADTHADGGYFGYRYEDGQWRSLAPASRPTGTEEIGAAAGNAAAAPLAARLVNPAQPRDQHGVVAGPADESPAAIAAKESSPSPEETAALDITASREENDGSVVEDAAVVAARVASKFAAIDRPTSEDAWERVEALYYGWKMLAEQEKRDARRPWMWSQTRECLDWLSRAPRHAAGQIHLDWFEGVQGAWFASFSDWGRNGLCIAEGLRLNARRQAEQRQVARQTLIRLLRRAANSMQQASGMLEDVADQWSADEAQQALQEEPGAWR